MEGTATHTHTHTHTHLAGELPLPPLKRSLGKLVSLQRLRALPGDVLLALELKTAVLLAARDSQLFFLRGSEWERAHTCISAISGSFPRSAARSSLMLRTLGRFLRRCSSSSCSQRRPTRFPHGMSGRRKSACDTHTHRHTHARARTHTRTHAHTPHHTTPHHTTHTCCRRCSSRCAAEAPAPILDAALAGCSRSALAGRVSRLLFPVGSSLFSLLSLSSLRARPSRCAWRVRVAQSVSGHGHGSSTVQRDGALGSHTSWVFPTADPQDRSIAMRFVARVRRREAGAPLREFQSPTPSSHCVLVVDGSRERSNGATVRLHG